jgi:LacI family transcriptional regulator
MEAVPRAVEPLEKGVTTIAEVAGRAGVSVATVSRVLNGSPAVSANTRRRVRAVIAELGYEPNAAARALSTGRTGAVGVVAPFLTQPSVVERLRGVSRVMAGEGLELVLFDVERPGPFAGLSAVGRLDALLCISLCPTEPDLERFLAAGVALALVDCEHPRVSGVSIDNREGGRLAAQHLLALGHRRIAYVGDEEDGPFGFTSSARRRLGAGAVVQASGARLLVRRAAHGREQARRLAADLLASDAPPTAVLAGSDLQALGVLEAAEAAGVPVPGRLSVIGFDNIEVARYAGLTTVAQPLEESGVRGAKLLLQALAGAPRSAQRLDLRLVVRTTTRPLSHAPAGTPAPSIRHDGIVRPRHPDEGESSCQDVLQH